jgi:CheY-like chemotaxis protein
MSDFPIEINGYLQDLSAPVVEKLLSQQAAGQNGFPGNLPSQKGDGLPVPASPDAGTEGAASPQSSEASSTSGGSLPATVWNGEEIVDVYEPGGGSPAIVFLSDGLPRQATQASPERGPAAGLPESSRSPQQPVLSPAAASDGLPRSSEQGQSTRSEPQILSELLISEPFSPLTQAESAAAQETVLSAGPAAAENLLPPTNSVQESGAAVTAAGSAIAERTPSALPAEFGFPAVGSAVTEKTPSAFPAEFGFPAVGSAVTEKTPSAFPAEFGFPAPGSDFSDVPALRNPLTGELILASPAPADSTAFPLPLQAVFKPIANAKSVGLRESVRGEPLQTLVFDAERTRQLLARLLSVTVGFSPKGGQVDFITDRQTLEADTVRLRFVIQARRLELPQPVMAYLNEAGSLPAGPPLENLALNLALCRELAALLGGNLSIRSTPAGESVFFLELHARKVRQQTKSAPEIGRFSGKRILLAVQEPALAAQTAVLLRKREIFVDTASDPAQALRLFRRGACGHYAAVLSSLGEELTRSLRGLNRPDSARTPIVAFLSSSSEQELSRAFQSGCDTCLLQPFSPRELFDTLQLVIL